MRGRPPAGAAEHGVQLTDQVKSVVTVVEKTHHYWSAHVAVNSAVAVPA